MTKIYKLYRVLNYSRMINSNVRPIPYNDLE